MQRYELLHHRAALVDVLDGSLLWGEQYSGKPLRIYSLADEISSNMAKQLKLKLTAAIDAGWPDASRNAEDSSYIEGPLSWGKGTA